MAGSGVIHAAYFACLQRGYRDGDLSLVYPVARGSGPVLATRARWCCWASGPARWRLAGGAVVVVAILSLAAPAVRAGAPGAGWALLTGLTIAVYTLWDKHAVGALDASPVVYFWATEVGVALDALALRAQAGRRWSGERGGWTAAPRSAWPFYPGSPTSWCCTRSPSRR